MVLTGGTRVFLLSLLVALFCTILVAGTMPDYGLSADEAFYFSIGKVNTTWLLQPTWETINEFWPIHDRHPPLLKISGGLFYQLFTNRLGLLDGISAFRLGVLPFVFLLSFSMTWYVMRAYGVWIGVFAGTSVILLPRVFFHAHLAALDFPITALWFSTVIVALYATRSVRSFIVVLLLLGAALATKLQGAFLGMTVGIYLTLQGFRNLTKTRHVLAYVVFAVRTILLLCIPLAIFFILWPYLWPDPWPRFMHYVELMLKHYPIETMYLGISYSNGPGDVVPWHYPFVVFFATLPLGIVLIGGMASILAFIKPLRHDRFFVVNMLVPLVMMALPQAIRYDGERLFLPAYPFAVVLTAMGLYRLRGLLGSVQGRMIPIIAIALTVYIGFSSFALHPYQYVYANEIVGGARGARDRGFETDYWGTSYKAVLPFLREHPNTSYCVFPWPDLLKGYWYQGMVPEIPVRLADQATVYAGDFSQCEYLVLLHRQGFFFVHELFWEYYRNDTPIFSEMVAGIPVVSVYRITNSVAP